MKRPYPELQESVVRIQTVVREEEEQFLRNLENGLRMLNDTFRKTKAAGSDTIAGADVVRAALDLRHPGRGHREPGGRPEPAARHGRLREGAARSLARSRAARPRPPTSSRPARSTRSRSRTTHGSEFLGYTTTASRGHASSASWRRTAWPTRRRSADARAADRPGPRPHARSTARAAARSATPATIRGERFVFQRRPTRRRTTTSPSTSARSSRGPSPSTTTAVAAGRRGPSRGDPPGALGDARPAPRPAPAPGQARPAGREQGRARPAPVRLRQPRGRRPRAAPRDRGDGQRAGPARPSRSPGPRCRSPRPGRWGRWRSSARSIPTVVRVVQMGEFSRELCGGTHLDNVGQVGLFKIVGEESVSAGTRRITALTGQAALDYVRQEEEPLAEVAAALEGPARTRSPSGSPALLEEVKTLKKQAAPAPDRGGAAGLGRRPARRRDRHRRGPRGDPRARRGVPRRAAAAHRRPPPQGGRRAWPCCWPRRPTARSSSPPA